jgi:hypothetical protein
VVEAEEVCVAAGYCHSRADHTADEAASQISADMFLGAVVPAAQVPDIEHCKTGRGTAVPDRPAAADNGTDHAQAGLDPYTQVRERAEVEAGTESCSYTRRWILAEVVVQAPGCKSADAADTATVGAARAAAPAGADADCSMLAPGALADTAYTSDLGQDHCRMAGLAAHTPAHCTAEPVHHTAAAAAHAAEAGSAAHGVLQPAPAQPHSQYIDPVPGYAEAELDFPRSATELEGTAPATDTPATETVKEA